MRLNLSFLKSLLAVSHDLIVTALALVLAYLVRYLDQPQPLPIMAMVQHGAILLATATVVYPLSGLYRGVWAYASVNDLAAIIRSTFITLLCFTAISFLATRMEFLPRSVPFITWFVLIALMGGGRMFYRLLRDGRLNLKWQKAGAGRTPVMLFGAGDEAEMFIRWLGHHPHAAYDVVGVIAENEKRVGRTIHDVRILGQLDDLENIVMLLRKQNRAPTRLIITKAAHQLGEHFTSLLAEQSTKLGLQLSYIPNLLQLNNSIDQPQLQERSLQLSDLLSRPEIRLEKENIASMLQGKCVLITGAGGSIGSELARQIESFKPSRLVLLDHSEFALYNIHTELADRPSGTILHPIIADVRQLSRLQQVFAEFQPTIVFHAAAIKHVPLAETNMAEAVRTNVLGSRHVFDLCALNKTSICVLISTDKAVEPLSVMGATKHVAERLAQDFDLKNPHTRFVAVRFGNVLGSTGSVVPRFQAQIAAGGPVTVTHADMTRFFMTVPEAVSLVLQASHYGLTQATHGRVLALDMGTPVKIADLARHMIRLSGKQPDVDIAIHYTGLRAGEKMHEALHGADETLHTAKISGLYEIQAPVRALSPLLLERLLALTEDITASADDLRQLLFQLTK